MPFQKSVLLASNNAHKHAELRALLAPHGVDVLLPQDMGLELEVAETGTSFAENAILKAEAFRTASGLTSLADDSGLVVEALGGEPGVHSARYGGPGLDDADRTALVLDRVGSVLDEERAAAFVAVVAVAVPGRSTRVFEGRVQGRLTRVPIGNRGFGYDPIFFYPPAGLTFAQLSREEKSTVSHRGRALRASLGYLLEALGDDILR